MTTFSKMLPDNSVIDGMDEKQQFNPIVQSVKQSHGFTLTPGSTSCNTLATGSLATCVGIAVHNTENGRIGLAHIDDYCKGKSIIAFVKNMISSDNETLKIYLTGGVNTYFGPEGGKEYFLPILKEIFAMPNIKVVEDFTFREGKGSKEGDFLAIDTDGDVFYDQYLFADYKGIVYGDYKMHDLHVLDCAGNIPDEYYNDSTHWF